MDRRSCFRRKKTFQVLVRTPARRFGSFVARNISAGGLFLETNVPFPEGCPIELYFALPEADQGVAASGTVKYRSRHAQIGGESIEGMGVSFVGFDGDGQHRLHDSLAQELH